jgi:hypothetical protein
MNRNDMTVKETTAYESCIGEKVELPKTTSLVEFMELDEEEKLQLEQDTDKEWQKHWVGMPEYSQEDNPPYKKLIVSFRSKEDYEEFSKLIDQVLSEKTKSIWHPKLDRDANALRRWIQEEA